MEIRTSPNFTWNLKDVLGQGATGAVYKGRNKTTGDEVAIKTTNHFGMMRPAEVRKREFEVLNKLKHENIVKIYASEKELRSQNEIIVMELCNGGSLYNLVEHPSNAYGFSEKDCIDIIKDVVAGMEHLREQGIVHRDLKPGNIMRMFRDDGTCVYKLTDFGAARELEHSDQFISIYGTEEYLHPDLYERGVLRKHSGKTFGANVDLWSLGVTFYHIATGKLPFRPHGGRQNKETMYHITTTKQSGMISGVQKSDGAAIEWSDKLPENTQLSRDFQDLLTPILAGVLESVPDNMMTFKDFFRKVQDMVTRKVIEVYYVQSSSFHRIYIKPNETFDNFQERVVKLTGLPSPLQKFYFNGELFNPHPQLEASKYPPTTRQHPMILMGGEFNESLLSRKVPTVFTLSNEWTLEGDSAAAKIIANCAFSCKFSVEFYTDTMVAMSCAIDSAIKSFKKDLLQISCICGRMEGRRATARHMTRVLCNSHGFLVSLLEQIIPHVHLSEEEKSATEEEINTIKTWIQNKRQSDSELGKANHFVNALRSVTTEVVDKDSLSPLLFDFSERTSKTSFYTVITTMTSKIEDIYTRYRKKKHMRRLSYPEEQNHMFDRKRLATLIDNVTKICKETFQQRVSFHSELQKILRRVKSYQDETYKQKRLLEEAELADQAHLQSLETTQMECQERYQRILYRIKKALTSCSMSSVGTDMPSLSLSNGESKQGTFTEEFFLEMENQIKGLLDTTENSKKTAKENMDQLKKLKSSFAEFYGLLNDQGLDIVQKLMSEEMHLVKEN